MSGYSEQEAHARFAGTGIAGFLHKPFRTHELRSRLDAILRATDTAD
jgi:DNA-binding response OmpR family regulator